MARWMAMASVAVRIGRGAVAAEVAAAAAEADDDDEDEAGAALFGAGAPSAAVFRLRGFFAEAGAIGGTPVGALPPRQAAM
jgi:hypothetical protein